ncbi:hypothetical protein [Streptomyces sp. NPDC088725]|uniref:hypothetical protein n=1 Tax=Streptomyces sp. NPDC088725 TaxID=3365873 RepID=UPI003828DB87
MGITVDNTLPATTRWLLRGKDGRLTAYAPAADGVLRWTESRVGGPGWSGPELLGFPGILPYVAVAQSPEGYVHLVVPRVRPRTDGPDDLDLLHALQYQTGRPIRAWQTMGNPHGKDREAAARIGAPTAVMDGSGQLQVFVHNAKGGFSAKRQSPTGKMLPYGGATPEDTPVTGPVAAVTTDNGETHVLAPADGTVLRWRLAKADAKPERAEAETEPQAKAEPGTITAERTGPGRATYFWRDVADGTVRAWRPGADPVALDGPGTGPPAVLRTPVDGVDCTILAQRRTDGRLAIAAYPTEDESAGLNWTTTGEPCAGAPALALDGRGRIVLAAIGTDGALRVARQKDEQGLALSAWTRA